MTELPGKAKVVLEGIKGCARAMEKVERLRSKHEEIGERSSWDEYYAKIASRHANAIGCWSRLSTSGRSAVISELLKLDKEVEYPTNPCLEIDLADREFIKQTTKPDIEKYMPRTTVKTVHYVNNMEVQLMSKDSLVLAVKDVEKEIKELEAVEVQSKAITGMIEELKKSLTFIVDHLDSKE